MLLLKVSRIVLKDCIVPILVVVLYEQEGTIICSDQSYLLYRESDFPRRATELYNNIAFSPSSPLGMNGHSITNLDIMKEPGIMMDPRSSALERADDDCLNSCPQVSYIEDGGACENTAEGHLTCYPSSYCSGTAGKSINAPGACKKCDEPSAYNMYLGGPAAKCKFVIALKNAKKIFGATSATSAMEVSNINSGPGSALELKGSMWFLELIFYAFQFGRYFPRSL